MLQEHVVPTKPNYYVVDDSLKPDVWFEPCKVMLCQHTTKLASYEYVRVSTHISLYQALLG
jgi:hypothetical protein